MNALVSTGAAPKVELPAKFIGHFKALPPTIQTGLQALDAVYTAGLQGMTREQIQLRAYAFAKAVAGFPSVVVEAALDYLLLNNPNTIKTIGPTPEQVRKCCERFNDQWECSLASYMKGAEWSPPRWAPECPAPGAVGHPHTMEQVRRITQASVDITIDRYLSCLDGEEDFNRLRPEVFDKGERDKLIASRAAAQERLRQVNASLYAN